MKLNPNSSKLEDILNSHVPTKEKIELILNIFGFSNKKCQCIKRKTTVREHVENICNSCRGIISENPPY